MSLPSSRPRTYVDGMPLIPEDINELFDANIDMKWPSHVLPLDIAEAARWNSNFIYNDTSVRFVQASGGPLLLSWSIRVPPGTRITSVAVAYNREASASVAIQLARTSKVGAQTIIASLLDTTSAGDITKDLAVDADAGVLPYSIAANETVSLLVNAAANTRIYGAYVTVDRL